MASQDPNLNVLGVQEPVSDTPEPGYLAIGQAAEGTPYSQEYVSLLVRKGKLPGQKFGRNWYIKKDDLEAYISAQAEKASFKLEEFAKVSQKDDFRPIKINTVPQKSNLVNIKPHQWYTPALTVKQIGLIIGLTTALSAPVFSNLYKIQDQVSRLSDQYKGLVFLNLPGPKFEPSVKGESLSINKNYPTASFNTNPLPNTSPLPVYAAPQVLGISSDEVIAAFRATLAQGLPPDILVQLKGEKGDPGNEGVPISYTQPSSTNYNSIGSIAGVTHLSGQDITAKTITVTDNITGNLSGNAATVTTNANLSGAVTSVGNTTSLGTFNSADLMGALTDETGTGLVVFGTAPTFASIVTVGTTGGTTGAINLKGTTSGTVTVTTAGAAGTYTLTLPTSAGSPNQVLKTDGSGGLGWVSTSAGSFFSNNSAAITNGSYLELAHNQATTDLIASGWVLNASSGLYERIDVNGNGQTSNTNITYTTESNYTQENMAYSVTLAPSATSGDITLTLGSGNWNVDGRVKAGCRVSGNGGEADITGTPAAQTTIAATTTTNFTNTNAIASGSWTLYCTKFAGGVAKINTVPAVSPTGGTISTSSGNTIHTFNSSGTFTTLASGNLTYLVVAGGGGGWFGGGGAGGMRTASGFAVTAQAYSITVGNGGAQHVNGGNSVFSSITSTGGGAGGDAGGVAGSNGGSGGGGGQTGSGGTGIAGQGNNGGNTACNAGGGGGGAGAVGGSCPSGPNTAGNGGAGSASSISGSSVTYAGGGGGGASEPGGTGGTGGAGGGGAGCTPTGCTGTAGTVNTGGGGGGSWSGTAGAGGSGIVILSFTTGSLDSPAATPTSTYYTVVTGTDRVDATSLSTLDTVTVTETLNSQTIHYALSFDARTTFVKYDSTVGNNGWRPIARNNSGTWQYNSNASAGVSNLTWTNSTTNAMNAAISQAQGVAANNMTGAQMNAVTGSQFREQNGYNSLVGTIDFSESFKTTNSAQIPQVDSIAVNYTKSNFKVVQTDNNTVRLYNYTGATQSLRLDGATASYSANVWSGLTSPVGNLGLTMGSFTSTFTFGNATSSNNLFNLTDTASNTGTGYLFNLTTASGSTLKPFHVSAAGTEALTVIANGNVGIGTTSPLEKLHISGGRGRIEISNSAVIAVPGGGGATVLDLYNTDTTAGNTAGLKFSSGTVVYSAVENVYSNRTGGAENGVLTFTTMGGGTRAERMRIDSSGNVGIGTTGPTGPLDVYGSTGRILLNSTTGTNTVFSQYQNTGGSAYVGLERSTGGNLITGSTAYAFALAAPSSRVMQFGTNDAVRMTIDTSGNVGVGVTGPSNTLHVRLDDATTNAVTDVLRVSKLTTGTPAAGLGAGILFESERTTGTFAVGRIAGVMENVDNNTEAMGLAFYTNNGGTGTPAERVRINGGGNVGIGTTGPSAPLDIRHTVNSAFSGTDATTFNTLKVSNLSNTANAGPGIVFSGDSTPNNLAYIAVSRTFDTAAELIFGTRSGSALGERMRIDESGNVGIGTTDPQVHLEVQGTNGGTAAMGVYDGTDRWRWRLDGGGRLQWQFNGADKGSLTTTGVWTDASDVSLKKDIEDLSYGLDELLQLRPRFYRMKDSNIAQIGFIAQEVELIVPEVVSGDVDGRKGLAYGHLTPVIIQGIKELDSRTTGVYQGSDVAVGEIVAFEEGSAGSVARADKADKAVGVIASSGKVSFTGSMPVRVSEENGAIKAGDRLTVSSLIPGRAAKLTQSGNSIGVALEDSAGEAEGLDTIQVFVQIGYQKIDVAQSNSGQIVSTATDKDLNMNGFAILNVKAIIAVNNKWSIDEFGNFMVMGHILVGKDTAGSVIIPAGVDAVEVIFEREYDYPPKVTATPMINAGSYWVSEKTASGFKIKLAQPAAEPIEFDWHALAVEAPPQDNTASNPLDLLGTAPGNAQASESTSESEPEIQPEAPAQEPTPDSATESPEEPSLP